MLRLAGGGAGGAGKSATAPAVLQQVM